MKALLLLSFLLISCFTSFASGNTPTVSVTAAAPHNAAHTPWYLFAGIVLAAAILGILTIANAEPKN